MKLLKCMFLLSLCCLTSACVEFEAALSPPAPLAPGSPLIGTWVAKDQHESAYLHIGNEGQGVRMVEVELDKSGSIKSESYSAAATALAGNTYLSVQTPRNGRPRYTLLKYQLSGRNLLTLWPANYRFLDNAVKIGLIAGSVEATTAGVLLSADQESLQRFVGDYGNQMFPEATVKLRRLP